VGSTFKLCRIRTLYCNIENCIERSVTMTRSSSKLLSVKSVRQGGRGRDGAMRARRRASTIRKGIDALGKPAIRRLARRAGVKRIHSGIYEEAPQALRGWLSKMVHDACTYAEHGKRFTITLNDVLLALKRNGVYVLCAASCCF